MSDTTPDKGAGLHLIIGGSGVLGRAIVKELASHGCRVRVLDTKPLPEECAGLAEFVSGSVTDETALQSAMEDVNVVHHLAASMPQARLSPRKFWEINVGATLNAFHAAVSAGAKAFVFASTIEIYGLHYPHEFPVTEESPKRFTGIYSRNKFECEKRLAFLGEETGLRACFLRMPMIFGPGFYHEPSMKLLFRLIRRDLPVPVLAAADAPWASVSSADAARAFWLCAENEGISGEAFNIAAPDAPPCTELLQELIKAAGSRSKVLKVPETWTEKLVDIIERRNIGPTPPELVRFALVGGEYSIAKARKMLGYGPCFSACRAMEEAFKSVCRINP